MQTRTLAAHAIFDEAGSVVSVVLLNGRTPEFYQVERMAFDEIGGFLREVITERNEKQKRGQRSDNAIIEISGQK